MSKKLLTIQKLGYIEPSITEIEIKVEAGFATSSETELEGISEEDPDSGF